MDQLKDHSAEERLTRIEARFEDTLPHLATKADIVGLKWALRYLGLIVLGGLSFLIHLISSMP